METAAKTHQNLSEAPKPIHRADRAHRALFYYCTYSPSKIKKVPKKRIYGFGATIEKKCPIRPMRPTLEATIYPP